MIGSLTRLIGSGATVALLAIPEIASAHGGGNVYVRAELSRLPTALAGMRIEVLKSVSPQLVLENNTQRTVEVLDDSGVPFLRIGPHGVEGNFASRSWYQTYSPGAVPPKNLGGSATRWVRIRSEPSFGWFDPRLDDTHVQVPHDVILQARTADVGRWQVPLRVDGRRVLLTGRFHYAPPAPGTYVSRLTSSPEIAPGVHVKLLPGRVPGLLVESASAQTLIVLGDEGEAFLRIDPQGVEANLHSPTWWQSARSGGRRPAGTDARLPPEWQRVARIPRFSWVEQRAAYPIHPSVKDAGLRVVTWQVPMLLGDEPLNLSGVVAWAPTAPGAH